MTLARLHELVGAEQGPLGSALVPEPPAGGEVFGPIVAAGRRAGPAPDEYGLLIESILEGYLLHYACARIVDTADADLRLLSGDYFYALGLSRLAALGDMDAVAELADLIALCAQAHAGAGSDPKRAWATSAGLWATAALAVGSGSWNGKQEAQQLVRAGRAEAPARLREAAAERAGQLGLGLRLEQALIAFDRAVNPQLSTT